jgi:hypothetical protein
VKFVADTVKLDRDGLLWTMAVYPTDSSVAKGCTFVGTGEPVRTLIDKDTDIVLITRSGYGIKFSVKGVMEYLVNPELGDVYITVKRGGKDWLKVARIDVVDMST